MNNHSNNNPHESSTELRVYYTEHKRNIGLDIFFRQIPKSSIQHASSDELTKLSGISLRAVRVCKALFSFSKVIKTFICGNVLINRCLLKCY